MTGEGKHGAKDIQSNVYKQTWRIIYIMANMRTEARKGKHTNVDTEDHVQTAAATKQHMSYTNRENIALNKKAYFLFICFIK